MPSCCRGWGRSVIARNNSASAASGNLSPIGSGRSGLSSGICLGYQLLFESSEETPGVAGFGRFAGAVRRFNAPGLKVPQIGWNALHFTHPDARLWRGWRRVRTFISSIRITRSRPTRLPSPRRRIMADRSPPPSSRDPRWACSSTRKKARTPGWPCCGISRPAWRAAEDHPAGKPTRGLDVRVWCGIYSTKCPPCVPRFPGPCCTGPKSSRAGPLSHDGKLPRPRPPFAGHRGSASARLRGRACTSAPHAYELRSGDLTLTPADTESLYDLSRDGLPSSASSSATWTYASRRKCTP